jgi:hypothetical protein
MKVEEHTELGYMHQLARLNVVMAALAILTGVCTEGALTTTEPYVPPVSKEKLALLKASVAMQTELSLSISVSDPMIWDASHGFAERAQTIAKHRELTDIVVGVDHILHEYLQLLAGKGPQLTALADELIAKGHLPISSVAEGLA